MKEKSFFLICETERIPNLLFENSFFFFSINIPLLPFAVQQISKLTGVILCTFIIEPPDFCLCENKGEDQLRSNCEADLRLCFR